MSRVIRRELGRSLLLALLLATGAALAEDAPKDKQEPAAADKKTQKEDAGKLGMSILGNQEAPKALVIVPWKSSELGRSLGISPMLDDSRQPVDKDVFLRALSYYQIRSETTWRDGAPNGSRGSAAAGSDATQPAAATHRRKQ